MLDSLPQEVLREVFAHVPNKGHLLALSRVSKKFRSLIFPQLFKVLAIKANDETCLWDLERCPYFAYDIIATVPNVLTAVKEVHFRAPFELTDLAILGDGKRCPHSFTQGLYTLSRSPPGSEEDDSPVSLDDSDIASRKQEDGKYLEELSDRSSPGSEEDDSPVSLDDSDIDLRKQEDGECLEELFDSEHGDYELIKLGKKIARLLSALPDNQLTGFRWDMGTCFPNAILGEEGYLVTHQNCIRKLSLTTELNCFSGGPPLKDFTNLQELSWKGLISDGDCDSLKAFFELHHERLTSLELDFIDWAEVEGYFDLPDDDDNDEDDATPLMDLILPEREDDYKDFLPNLQTFSLSAASFRGSWDCLVNAFNLRNLKELRLLNCKQTVELLEYMALTDIHLDATKIELILRQPETHLMESHLVDFLAPFHGLEDLFLMFQSDYADECYFEMILRYRDTLRRLVFHRRFYCLDEKAPYWQEYYDNPLDEREGGGFTDVLRDTKLEYVGVCEEPSKLQNSFQSKASTVNSLKLLHLRFTGKAERKPKFLKVSEAYEADSPPPEFVQDYLEAVRNGTTPPRRSPGPSEAEFRSRWEQIQGENWHEDEEKELEAFADWAFGPDGFPCLQVLASGDFSYSNRFVDTQRLWCRNSRESRSKKSWRTVEQGDVAEKELIDANMDMMSACPVSPLLYRYGRGDEFPGIS